MPFNASALEPAGHSRHSNIMVMHMLLMPATVGVCRNLVGRYYAAHTGALENSLLVVVVVVLAFFFSVNLLIHLCGRF